MVEELLISEERFLLARRILEVLTCDPKLQILKVLLRRVRSLLRIYLLLLVQSYLPYYLTYKWEGRLRVRKLNLVIS
ncbi:MAG: hypothetical protein DRJ40_07685 [Thermoprotei archaeon]|nr:MAG: hypothetical protein DRJ40_07685 [Thermoprotei archaeon]